ncbi:polyprotein [rajidapivirus A1]|uniref:Genome polyprotein n=1 Tax=rajidapivirus A1 TaxID=2116206 RepID=A0A2P1GN41_9PICO|nr:polyprotein [rajidapivirus A1]AVM87417.1 polyprotein [rajidapivirus A1]
MACKMISCSWCIVTPVEGDIQVVCDHCFGKYLRTISTPVYYLNRGEERQLRHFRRCAMLKYRAQVRQRQKEEKEMECEICSCDSRTCFCKYIDFSSAEEESMAECHGASYTTINGNGNRVMSELGANGSGLSIPVDSMVSGEPRTDSSAESPFTGHFKGPVIEEADAEELNNPGTEMNPSFPSSDRVGTIVGHNVLIETQSGTSQIQQQYSPGNWNPMSSEQVIKPDIAAERPTLVYTSDWDTTMGGVFTPIHAATYPEELLKVAPENMAVPYFQRYRLFRTGYKFSIITTATQFMSGMLLVVFVPSGMVPDENPAQMTLYPHCIINLRATNTGEFEVPFCSQKPWCRSNYDQNGVLCTYVISPLQVTAGSTQKIEINYFAQLANPEFTAYNFQTKTTQPQHAIVRNVPGANAFSSVQSGQEIPLSLTSHASTGDHPPGSIHSWREYAQTPSFLVNNKHTGFERINWDSTAGSGTGLLQIQLTPSQPLFEGTNAGVAASSYAQWNGDIVVTLFNTGAQQVYGKYVVCYTPASIEAPTTMQEAMQGQTHVVDLGLNDAATFVFKYVVDQPWRTHSPKTDLSSYMGRCSIWVLNPITFPAGAPTSVNLVPMVSAGPNVNFRFVVPNFQAGANPNAIVSYKPHQSNNRTNVMQIMKKVGGVLRNKSKGKSASGNEFIPYVAKRVYSHIGRALGAAVSTTIEPTPTGIAVPIAPRSTDDAGHTDTTVSAAGPSISQNMTTAIPNTAPLTTAISTNFLSPDVPDTDLAVYSSMYRDMHINGQASVAIGDGIILSLDPSTFSGSSHFERFVSKFTYVKGDLGLRIAATSFTNAGNIRLAWCPPGYDTKLITSSNTASFPHIDFPVNANSNVITFTLPYSATTPYMYTVKNGVCTYTNVPTKTIDSSAANSWGFVVIQPLTADMSTTNISLGASIKGFRGCCPRPAMLTNITPPFAEDAKNKQFPPVKITMMKPLKRQQAATMAGTYQMPFGLTRTYTNIGKLNDAVETLSTPGLMDDIKNLVEASKGMVDNKYNNAANQVAITAEYVRDRVDTASTTIAGYIERIKTQIGRCVILGPLLMLATGLYLFYQPEMSWARLIMMLTFVGCMLGLTWYVSGDDLKGLFRSCVMKILPTKWFSDELVERIMEEGPGRLLPPEFFEAKKRKDKKNNVDPVKSEVKTKETFYPSFDALGELVPVSSKLLATYKEVKNGLLETPDESDEGESSSGGVLQGPTIEKTITWIFAFRCCVDVFKWIRSNMTKDRPHIAREWIEHNALAMTAFAQKLQYYSSNPGQVTNDLLDDMIDCARNIKTVFLVARIPDPFPNEMIKMCNRLAVLKKNCREGSRPEPAVIYLHGPPGCGKSFVSMIMAKMMAAQHLTQNNESFTPSDLSEHIYAPGSGNLDHFDGYRQQLIHIVDDIGQDPEGEDWRILPNMISSTPFIPPMAAIEDKGMYYTTPFIICTSNSADPPANAVRCVAALNRRISRKYQVVLNAQYSKPNGTLDTKEALKIDEAVTKDVCGPFKVPYAMTDAITLIDPNGVRHTPMAVLFEFIALNNSQNETDNLIDGLFQAPTAATLQRRNDDLEHVIARSTEYLTACCDRMEIDVDVPELKTAPWYKRLCKKLEPAMSFVKGLIGMLGVTTMIMVIYNLIYPPTMQGPYTNSGDKKGGGKRIILTKQADGTYQGPTEQKGDKILGNVREVDYGECKMTTTFLDSNTCVLNHHGVQISKGMIDIDGTVYRIEDLQMHKTTGDLVICRLPHHKQNVVDLTKYLPTTDYVINQNTTFITLTPKPRTMQLGMPNQTNVRIYGVTYGGVVYRFPSAPGNCGGIYYTEYSNKPMIVGFHFGGVSGKMGFCAPLSFMDYSEACADFQGKTLTPCEITRVHTPTKSKLRKSPFYGLYEETKQPSPLSEMDPRIKRQTTFIARILEKSTTNKPVPQFAEEAMDHWIERNIKNMYFPILSVEEALNLDGGIDLTQSVGYPYVNRGMRRKDFVDVDANFRLHPTQLLLDELETYDDRDQIWTTFPKDELRSIEKIEMGKPRFIDMCPFPMVVKHRQLIGSFLSYCTQNFGTRMGSAVGCDPDIYWTQLYHELEPLYCYDGDYSGYDGTTSAAWYQLMAEKLASFVPGFEQFKNEIVIRNHIYQNITYESFGSTPSGMVGTSIINSIINFLNFTSASWRTGHATPTFISYGDDFLCCFKKEPNFGKIIDNINTETDFKVTSATKGDYVVGSGHISDVTFLKRWFCPDPKFPLFVHPTIDPETYEQSVMWYKNTECMQEKLTSLTQLAYHAGPKNFKAWRDKIALTLVANNLTIPTYSELEATWLGKLLN